MRHNHDVWQNSVERTWEEGNTRSRLAGTSNGAGVVVVITGLGEVVTYEVDDDLNVVVIAPVFEDVVTYEVDDGIGVLVTVPVSEAVVTYEVDDGIGVLATACVSEAVVTYEVDDGIGVVVGELLYGICHKNSPSCQMRGG